MDKGTVIGLVLAAALVVGAMALGGSILVFVDVQSIMIVVGGTIATVLVNERMELVVGAVKVGMNAVFEKGENIDEINDRMMELAQNARRNGVLGIENEEVPTAFMKKGLRLVCDGASTEAIRATLGEEMAAMKRRHERGELIFRFAATNAPAMGMVGTLIGLVQMLQALDDPSSIGPAMAVALLTTLYGALIANVMCTPIAEKLNKRTIEEATVMRAVIEGYSSISMSENPMFLREKLNAFSKPKDEAEAAA